MRAWIPRWAMVLAAATQIAAVGPDLGANLDLDEAFREGQPHYVRAVAEMVLLLGVGTTWYWVKPGVNARDWDYPTLRERFSEEGVRFDNNSFVFNSLLHPFSGANYYGFARENDLGPGAAFAAATLTSAVWEFGLEYREKPSINDLIMTPSGAPIGEWLHQLDDYVHSAPEGGGRPQRAAALVFGLPGTLHGLFDGRRHWSGEADSLGFSAAFAHRFELAYEQQGAAPGVALEGELDRMPGIDRPGTWGVFFDGGNFTELKARAAFGGGVPEADVRARATLFGWYGQDLRSCGGDRCGVAGRVGLELGYDFVRRLIEEREDLVAVAHLAGPAAEVGGEERGLAGRLTVSAHPDFATVQALALAPWRSQHEGELRSILTEQGYDYAFGWSGRARATLAWRGAELGGEAQLGQWRSITGHDRVQEDVTREVALHEEALETTAWIAYGSGLRVRLAVEQVDRRSALEEVVVRLRERRVVARLGVTF